MTGVCIIWGPSWYHRVLWPYVCMRPQQLGRLRYTYHKLRNLGYNAQWDKATVIQLSSILEGCFVVLIFLLCIITDRAHTSSGGIVCRSEFLIY